jgi:chorismate mutase
VTSKVLPSDTRVLPADTDDIESRMGIEPVAALLARRAVLIGQVAPLRARHGDSKHADARRKLVLDTIAAKVRAEAVAGTIKKTEAAIAEEAHASNGYADFMTKETTERAELTVLENQIQAINDQINRGQAIARYLSAELALTR